MRPGLVFFLAIFSGKGEYRSGTGKMPFMELL
jgi:hypothetical protein